MHKMATMPVSDVMDINTLTKTGSLSRKDVLKWSVHSNDLRRNGSLLRSDVFSFGQSRLKFYLAACSDTNSHYFSVSLIRVKELPSNESPEGVIKVSFSILDTRDRCHHICERTLHGNDMYVHAMFAKGCFDTHHLMFLTEDRLTIQCGLDLFEVVHEYLPAGRNSNIANKEVPEEDLSIDLLTLLDSGLHSDITLVVGEQEFKVHRSILATRSSFFEAMFKYETLDKGKNRVDIVDVTSEVMYQLLRYLYTGKIEDVATEVCLSIFVAADKYALAKLKQQCSTTLCSCIDSKLAIETLILANLHQDDDLRIAAKESILNNAVEVMNSDEWLIFLKEHSEIANNIILALAMKSACTVST